MGKRKPPKPARNKCIAICTHAHCGLLCTNPGFSATSTANTNINETINAVDPAKFPATDLHPGQLSVPLTPGSHTVILGQKEVDFQTEKCMWVCSSDMLLCGESCWSADDAQGAAVADGGILTEDEGMEKMTECQVVGKDEVGRLIVCAVPVADGGNLGGERTGMNGMRCMLFWRDRKPYLTCREV